MIYRIFLELFKSKSPLRECYQGHETKHYSVFSISVKGPSSSPPTLEWLISCPRLPLGIFELYRDIRRPPLQLNTSICFLLFHKTERTPLYSKPDSSPSPFPSTTLAHQRALFPLTIISFTCGNPAHLSSMTRVKSQLHSYFIIPPLIMLWRKLCTTLSY